MVTKSKVQELFDKNNFIVRPLPEQEKFESEYKPMLVRLVYLIDRAFNLMDAIRKEKPKMAVNKNWAANEMNGNLWYLISGEFSQFVRDTKRGSFYLNLNDKYECYIKKLYKKELQPAYNHSITSRKLCNQQACINEEPIPVIFIGYTAKKKMQVITGYYAVCVKDDKVVWQTDLLGLLPSKQNVDYGSEKQMEPTIKVTVKQKKKAQ